LFVCGRLPNMWCVWCVIHVYTWVTHKLRVGKTQMWFPWCKQKLGWFYVMCLHVAWPKFTIFFTTFVVNYKALKPILGRYLFSGMGHFFYKKLWSQEGQSCHIFSKFRLSGHRHGYVLFLHNGMLNRYANVWYPLDINLGICIGTYS
jgi:hypothetical protein